MNTTTNDLLAQLIAEKLKSKLDASPSGEVKA